MVRRQSSSSSPCRTSGFQEAMEGFDCKINGQALRAALRHSLGGSDRQAQTQGVSESAALAVAAGLDRHAWWKRATDLSILTLFWSQKSFDASGRDDSDEQVSLFMCNEISMDFSRACCRPKPCSFLRAIFRSFIGLWACVAVKIMSRNKTACSESNPVQTCSLQQVYIDGPQGVWSDSNQTAQRFQMAVPKSLETMSAIVWPKFAAKSVTNEMRCLKDVETCIHWTIFDFWFDDFFSSLPLKIITHCVIDQPSITQSRRSVLNFKFSVVKYLRLMSCSISIEQKLVRATVSRATWVRFLQSDETLCRPLPFCVPVIALTPCQCNESVRVRHVRFYIAALSIFFFLGFRQWRSSADWALTLNMNIRLLLFWSTWSRARGPDSATCVGLAHARDYSICIASEQKWQNRLGHCVSLNCRKYLKHSGPRRPHAEHGSNLTPPRLVEVRWSHWDFLPGEYD